MKLDTVWVENRREPQLRPQTFLRLQTIKLGWTDLNRVKHGCTEPTRPRCWSLYWSAVTQEHLSDSVLFFSLAVKSSEVTFFRLQLEYSRSHSVMNYPSIKLWIINQISWWFRFRSKRPLMGVWGWMIAADCLTLQWFSLLANIEFTNRKN